MGVFISHLFRNYYWINRKNCCVPEIGFVTVFWPLMTTGAGETVVQASEAGFVVDCSV